MRHIDPFVFPAPSIAGVRLGGPRGPGHFIAVLEKRPEGFVVGDPMQGRETLSPAALAGAYHLTGFFLVPR